uniref:B30.2/SPRY domain-containing protein n=1 Tax=Neogobius melanostomus TaxID=47308 RepID=A0A8C6STZ8_9GOBI
HPLCPLCEFSLHPQHRVVSGEEAQRRLKELISSQLQTLTEEKHQCEELQQSYEEIQLYAEKQAGDCERHIRTGFSRLHQFLQEEEQRALSALREEQLRQKKNISPELEKLREKLSSVDKIIQELQQQLETHTYRPRQESTPPCPRPKAGLLLDQAKVLGNLGFRVWTRMKRLVTYQPVVLDPNTASPKLSLSDDLSTVRRTETLNKELPEVPERFSHYAIVLGSVGYSSGTHQWDVEVGDHPHWYIGVAKESIERKEECGASLVNELLCFGYSKGKYNDGPKLVKVEKSPEKIRVKLDFNKGTLSFSDTDHMTPLCSNTVPKGTSTDKLFPYFSVGPAGGTKTKELKIWWSVNML